MRQNFDLSEKLKSVIEGLHPKPNEISFAVIDLKGDEPVIAGYNMDHLIYPASIYKVFIAAEILRQVDLYQRRLDDTLEIGLDTAGIRLFPLETKKDHRPLLKIGDKVTIDYLLDLMLTRSDNIASNTLVGLAGWKNISNFIASHGWQGSAVTQEHLDMLKEKRDGRISSITKSSARHLAELFYKIESGQLINPIVSAKLKEYMLKGTTDREGGLVLPEFKSYYQKGGSLEIHAYKYNLLKSLVRLFLPKRYIITRYRGEAGMVKGVHSHYAIALLTQIQTKWPWRRFDMENFSKKIHAVMEERAT